MTKLDVVLINCVGCELARETITNERDFNSIIKDWEIYPGDTIKIEEFWHEQ